MSVEVKGLGWLKNYLGEGKTIKINGRVKLIELITDLFNEKKEAISRIIKDGKISQSVIILLNGSDARLYNDAQTEITDGDQITIIPVVHGG
ncbi:hypothetical protein B9Q11_02800 [Candidatus Marsarchaeota G2 archaeon ECH_B_SAG-F08]|jgi:molybdopterin converting factor small subunit|uniref:Molybdopterin synthase sulfur carrier subunit n=5 Tax=Candidatus Marsarchaeota TaxID=1978152 RepID=A0A2R6AKE2_9ARCH|nr:MAG: hypothetical protein B9Q01_01050 [Candidatus Marsarchaeota G1 archaeon OSP_D]PSN86850.1 MAG: hypothetical protein B9Q02_00075 [Candidatus Marsarchaeota G1 archaeon BE_D]PSN89121.1 MAG: hypothetical protein B9Q00_02550 [Candidatus Marsarchaeota G1 archaeon OSP_C]PSN93148.1 MAG: hypothetical protein B9P99_02655 [Candidatus Marsarchaeota G1 archaeon OSP_B]PSN98150.1 MAG: hypothetical protein B9Q11_02800 [Candidatus Marsarchaeota G2 archaeon ECH_B_SAG-F08]